MFFDFLERQRKMIVLVCGGRDYNDWDQLSQILSAIHLAEPITLLIHGVARGADRLAGQWANDNGIPVRTFPANWERYGKSAGPVRNQQMLDEGKPDLVISFPGAQGTADMVARAKKAGLPVGEVPKRGSEHSSTQPPIVQVRGK